MNIIPSDVLQGPHAYGPAVFWLSNPNNTLTNNVGSGSQGSVFWIEPEPTPNPAGMRARGDRRDEEGEGHRAKA